MARPRKLEPSYCRDKSSNRAFVTLNGKRKYLGEWNTQTSRDAYDVAIGEWKARGRQPGMGASNGATTYGITVSTLIAAYLNHVERYYRKPDGSPTSEVDNMRQALRPLRQLYGVTPVVKFGPLALTSLQEHMIKLGWCRRHINKQISRIRMCFKWGAGRELWPKDIPVYEPLRTVQALMPGRSDAKERPAVKPVAESHAAAIFPYLSPQVQAMVELQAITGMRPGEACAMRGCDIVTSGKTWQYTPASHKTAHHGHTRIIDLGPRAREIVSKFLKPDLQRFLFSPAEAEASRRAKLHADRKTPDSEGNQPGEIHRRFNSHYTVTTYRKAIQRACDRAFPPPAELSRQQVQGNGRKKKAMRWETDAEYRKRLGDKWPALVAWQAKHKFHPHQLRHTAATRWRKEFGADAALVLLGDKTTRMIDVYAEKDRETATKIMEKIG